MTARASIVIAAGGTGGHIYPGLALAEAITAARSDARITFVGTPKGMESQLVPREGYELRLYDMLQFAGQGWRKALVPPVLLRASVQARGILRGVDADIAVSMGGYTGVPLVAGARLAGVPSIVHEPGAVPGKANLLAARFTRNVATSFAPTRFPRREVRLVGYPLRSAFDSFDRDALRPVARAAYGLDDDVAMILVSGGSQGSLTLNNLALGLARRWAGRRDVKILLKAGSRTHDQIAASLEAEPGRDVVNLVRYIDRMDHAYASADLAICRAGAATVSELAVAGLPAVLVPFPYDEHDEQLHNAQPLIDVGGALLVHEADATADFVGPQIESRLADRAMLSAMGTAITSCARRGAAADLAAWVLELAGAS
jgi:UDP-N-acetylglucosamine--N-acetylmuramyl-(pentapeptide) pyrophosphoryl-undecaprenol N-acetylglucosamine transferase